MAVKDPEVVEAGGESRLALFENKVILLGVIVIVQAIVAIGLTQFLIVPRLGVQDSAMVGSLPAAEVAAAMPELGVLLGLEEIIVTLAGDAKRPRYLRISVNLELKDQLTADRMATRLPQLRDIVIMVLSEKTAADLSQPNGKRGLRDEIFLGIDEKIPAGVLMNVYFSDLVVQ